MEELIKTVNQYPFTSFCTFLMLYILFGIVLQIAKIAFLKKED